MSFGLDVISWSKRLETGDLDSPVQHRMLQEPQCGFSLCFHQRRREQHCANIRSVRALCSPSKGRFKPRKGYTAVSLYRHTTWWCVIYLGDMLMKSYNLVNEVFEKMLRKLRAPAG